MTVEENILAILETTVLTEEETCEQNEFFNRRISY